MAISTEQIKELRDKTSAGFSACKKALEEANGDLIKAAEILRKQGQAIAEKKSTRITKEGCVEAYIHFDNKLGVLLELNCETDFVAKNEIFKNLAKELVKQIAATNPKYISIKDVPEEVIQREKEIYLETARREGKKENVLEKVVSGRMNKFYQEVCLLEQPYIKDDKKKVKDLIQEAIAKTKENITVGKFTRFKIGEV